MTSTNDTYQRITDTIITQLEEGTKPWIRPWRGKTGSIVPRRSTGDAYRGINVIMLWIASQIAGYEETTWMTYKQASELGGQVRKGEKGSLVVKYGTFTPKEERAGGDEDEKRVGYLKGYTVFNVEQIENLPSQFFTPVEPQPSKPVVQIETVEQFVANTKARIAYGGTQACYRPTSDDIQMPDRERFLDETHLYSTLLHELSHWSGADRRLARDLTGRFGQEKYAMEELIAEMSAAFLCADLGVAHDPRENTASYLASWLKVLKSDKRAIVTAAAKAQAAADYLHTFQKDHVSEAA